MIIYDIALTMIPEIGNIRGRRLIEVFGTAEAAMKVAAEDIAEQTQIPFSAVNKLVNNSVFPDAEAEIKFARENGIEIIPITSGKYPERLRECCDAPLVLYVKGDIDFNSDWWISVVGTRKATSYGKEITQEIIRGIAETLPSTVIVSGLAYGTDITAHLAAMDNGLKTVAVMGNPLNMIYPAQHAEYADRIIATGGALVSEFHSKFPVQPNNFLRRNRIIAGLSSGTIVVESAYRGGSLSTANYAHGYDRDVMAVPGRITDKMSEGTNNLIVRQKAAMVQSSKDVFDVLNWAVEERKPNRGKELSPQLFAEPKGDQKVLYDTFGSQALSFDDLSVKTNMPVYKVSALLFEMEMDGIVRIKPGNMAEKI